MRAFLFAGLVATLSVNPAPACTCKAPRTPAQAKADSAYAFSGTVSEIGIDYSRNERITMFRVDKVFKGKIPAVLKVYSHIQDGDCGYAFERDRSYLVFAFDVSGRVFTHLCSGNRALSLDAPPPSEVGEGAAPAGPSDDVVAAARVALAEVESGRGPVVVAIDGIVSDDVVAAFRSLRKVILRSEVPETEKYILPEGYLVLDSLSLSIKGDRAWFTGLTGPWLRHHRLDCGTTHDIILRRQFDGTWKIESMSIGVC